MKSYPGLDTDVLTYPEERIAGCSAATRKRVVRVYGQDLDVLRAKAAEVRRLVAGVDGHPTATCRWRSRRWRSRWTWPRRSRPVSSPVTYAGPPRAMLSGIQVGNLFEDQKVFEVVGLGAAGGAQQPDQHPGPQDRHPSGGRSASATSPTCRSRRARPSSSATRVSRYVDVTAGIKGRDYRAVVGDVEKLRRRPFPLEHHAELLGATSTSRRTRTGCWWVAAALIAIFLLMQAAIGSWKLTALLFLALPVAMAGGLVAG